MDTNKIKSANEIVQVIGKHVQLKRSGRRYSGLCPFHDDHSPSLTVDPDRQSFICFACGAKGDVISFVQQIRKCSFKEAVEELTNKCTIDNAQLTIKKNTACSAAVPNQAREQKKIVNCQLSIVNRRSALANCLLPYTPGIPGLGGTYAEFGVSEAMHLLPAEWKMMAGRIIFPVHDHEGTLVGYAGRGESPKYLNTPGLPRAQILYGLHLAKEEIRRSGTLYLVEGFKDVIAMHAAGLKNTVGLCGTQMAQGQLELLRRYAHRVVIVMDGDKAGEEAARKIAELLWEKGIENMQVHLPEGEDPDSYFRFYGPKQLVKYIYKESNPVAEAEGMLITAITLYPDVITLCRGELLTYPVLVSRKLKEEDLPFEWEEHRRILDYYATGPAEEIPENQLQEEFELWCDYEDKLVELQEAIATHHKVDESKASVLLLERCLLVYQEARLIRIIKDLLRKGDLQQLTHRREQLTAVSLALRTAGAKRG